MSFLRNAWYAALWTKDLQERPVHRRLLGEPIALFRTSTGIAALADSCPHRFAPLHMGHCVTPDRIRCPYHGLEFDATGACVRNPHPSGRIPAGAKVRAYPAMERHGMVWVWMGEAAPDDSLPDFSFLDRADPRYVSARGFMRMQANYRLVVENLLDLSHAVFLHDGILGTPEMVKGRNLVEPVGTGFVAKRFIPDAPVPRLQDTMFHRDGRRVDSWADITWFPPSYLINEVGVCDVGAPRESGTGFRGIHLLTPETEATTLYHFVAIRWNPLPVAPEVEAAIQQQLTDLRRMAFVEQDAPVIEAIQRNMQDSALDTSRPVLFEVDSGPVQFNRRLDELIAREQGAGRAAA